MIIANATPLIYLHRVRQLELLHQLFTQVAIPEEEAFVMISMRTTRPFVFHADCFVAISKLSSCLHYASASSNAFASWRSAVSNPSVNQS